MKEAEANPSAEGPPPSWTFLMNFCGIVCGEDQIFAAGRDTADENSLCAFDSALQHLSLSRLPSLGFLYFKPSSFNLSSIWTLCLAVRAGQGQGNDNIPSFSGQIRSAATCAPANTLR